MLSAQIHKSTLLLLLFLAINLTFTYAQMPNTATIPLGGNAFIVQGTENGARIGRDGLNNWTSKQTEIDVFFYAKKPTDATLSLICAPQKKQSNISVDLLNKQYVIHIKENSLDTIKIAKVQIPTSGYIKIKLKGKDKTGADFGEIKALFINGDNIAEKLAYVKDRKDFHFGRRGPSVHWNYIVPTEMKDKVAYFYNEIYVPKGNDVVGSYFEADGFSCGYFGIQVNSLTERRILFSVWSPYETNHPGEIPDNQKIKLIKKGGAVHAGAFGGEGSGGQSFLKYNWKPDTHYAFLLKAAPDSANNTTTFTAYFKEVGTKNWLLIASFQRPMTNTYLKQLYAFLENFSPNMGNITRKAFYTNQWVCSTSGKWLPVTKARFTTDATGNADKRLDYIGGVENGDFYLQNCGFFDSNGKAARHKTFSRKMKETNPPKINFNQLP